MLKVDWFLFLEEWFCGLFQHITYFIKMFDWIFLNFGNYISLRTILQNIQVSRQKMFSYWLPLSCMEYGSQSSLCQATTKESARGIYFTSYKPNTTPTASNRGNFIRNFNVPSTTTADMKNHNISVTIPVIHTNDVYTIITW